MRKLWFTIFAASVALVAGCGGKSNGNELASTPATPIDSTKPTPDPIPPPNGVCPVLPPECDPGDREIPSEQADCAGGDYCYAFQVACTSDLIWCRHDKVANCVAVPTCDEGDTPVAEFVACSASTPSGEPSRCYTRSVCGSSYQCVKPDASCPPLPQCNPGDVAATTKRTCNMPGRICYPVTGCGLTIQCYRP